ncbi:MAG TPA: ABC-type transport auxiliary lipoprotein family protein [Syntrophales bacterium]|nr:ABC-type transport auxiliary lipoprotein family protein [Syntrophales bacterium]
MRGKNLFILVLLLLVVGCVGGQVASSIEYYMLDYASPIIKSSTPLNVSLRVERFSVAQLFNSNAMLYRTGSFNLTSFSNDRWRVNPGDIITDSLIRDFRHAGIFRGVFSYRDTEVTRFVLEGNVTEFLAVEEKGSPKALLTIYVTLLDLKQKEITRKIVFQKMYSQSAECNGRSPGEIAQGLSKSMEQLSGQIISDVYQAVKSVDSAASD